jgi:hypothetical protein
MDVDRHVLHYDENTKWYCRAGYEVQHPSDSEFELLWKQELKRLSAICETGQAIKICIDISSITRSRMALLVDGLRRHGAFAGNVVDFVYSLAEFSHPSENQPPNIHVGPVIPAFAGWWTEPDRATTVLVGLGYEQDKALGAVEHLQPGEVYVFAPESPVSEYAPIVQRANKILLQIVPSSHRMTYRIDQPFNTIVDY